MGSLVTLICYFLFGTILVVVVGIVIELKRKSETKRAQMDSDSKNDGQHPGHK